MLTIRSLSPFENSSSTKNNQAITPRSTKNSSKLAISDHLYPPEGQAPLQFPLRPPQTNTAAQIKLKVQFLNLKIRIHSQINMAAIKIHSVKKL